MAEGGLFRLSNLEVGCSQVPFFRLGVSGASETDEM